MGDGRQGTRCGLSETVRARRRTAGLLSLMAVLVTSGCSLIQSPERTYVTNREILEQTSKRLGIDVDPETFTVVAADLRDDAITLQYTGKQFPGDQAWIIRFSEKSTEQDPVALSDVHPLVRALREGRRDFNVVESGRRKLLGDEVRYLKYTFESPLRGAYGEALIGRGFVAVLRRLTDDGPLIYQVKLDNYGDRDVLEFSDLAPLLDALAPVSP